MCNGPTLDLDSAIAYADASSDQLAAAGIVVKVVLHNDRRTIEYRRRGARHNPGDGIAAYTSFRPDGAILCAGFYFDGLIRDPDAFTPGWTTFHSDGTPQRVERWRCGQLCDTADGTPSMQQFYPDGSLHAVTHRRRGLITDPATGLPAVQRFWPNGLPQLLVHFTNNRRNDPADGTPAHRAYSSDGTLITTASFRSGLEQHDLPQHR